MSKSEHDRYLKALAEFGKKLGEQTEELFYEHAEELPSWGGSPIEELVGVALSYALRHTDWFGGMGWGDGADWPCQDIEPAAARSFVPHREGLWAWFQAPVGKYTADFLICTSHMMGGYVWGAIECDGHDHHNLTKEQAQHDRERDRYFQSEGIFILRYTGSEIWKSPLKVVVDAITLLQARAKEPTAKRWRT